MADGVRPGWTRGVPTDVLLALAALALGALRPTDLLPTLGLIGTAVALGAVLRRLRTETGRSLAVLPVLAALGVGAVRAPFDLVSAVVAGGAGLAALVWLADDPHRPPGGIARARLALLWPTLAVAMAWMSALLLPPGTATLGAAAALLAFVLAAVALLLARPRLFDREEAATS